jgi:signal transduction protein with GAF and PtsI domain
MTESASADAYLDINFLHELGKRISSAPLNEVLWKIVRFVSDFVNCDSCFLYILEGEELVLKSSRNPHEDILDRLRIPLGQGITGWVARHKMSVAIPRKAYQDPRFKSVSALPEDQFEAFLSVPMICRDRLVGVINVQHRQPKFHSRRDIQLISIIGFLVAAEVELVRMESALAELSIGPGKSTTEARTS